MVNYDARTYVNTDISTGISLKGTTIDTACCNAILLVYPSILAAPAKDKLK